MSPNDFIAAMLPGAQKCQQDTGVPVGVTLAQAACESAWGAKAPGNNLFGIKADDSWTGQTVDFLTHEEYNGRWVEITAKFRAYPDFAGSLVDHGQFLKNNPRYGMCFQRKDAISFAKCVAAAGYATADNYAQTLCAIINSHNLSQYDVL